MPIESKIRRFIRENGSIKLDEAMSEVMSMNPSSYYRRRAELGVQGDFTTAPEISQLFGEIIALWAIDQWYKIGSPKRTNLVELGPGQGLLMRDLLKVVKLVPDFYNSLTIELIEINPHFIKKQQDNLKFANITINHHSSVEQVASLPTIIIANEFFDAMPIKQYLKSKDLWYESIFIIDPADSKIKFDKIAVNKELQKYLLQTHCNAGDGAIIEESYKSLAIIKFISNHLLKFSGAGLIIDYGYDIDPRLRTRHQYNPTLQAVKNHQYHPILESLGEADLSAHVDFHALKIVINNMAIETQITTQGDFLMKYGILPRSRILQTNSSALDAYIIASQVDRLIASGKMGQLFKTLYFAKGQQ
jgi:SAM-dependent MidA family methyltransferase